MVTGGGRSCSVEVKMCGIQILDALSGYLRCPDSRNGLSQLLCGYA